MVGLVMEALFDELSDVERDFAGDTAGVMVPWTAGMHHSSRCRLVFLSIWRTVSGEMDGAKSWLRGAASSARVLQAGYCNRDHMTELPSMSLSRLFPRSLAGKPLAWSRATPTRRIAVLHDILVYVIRFTTLYYIDNRR